MTPKNGSGQRLAVVALDRDVEHQRGRRVAGADAGEIRRPAEAAALAEHAQHFADLASMMAAQRRLSRLAQAPRVLLDDLPATAAFPRRACRAAPKMERRADRSAHTPQ